jgi:diacylglycerol O-acyltransferase
VPERLTGLDALFLYAETPSMPMHVAVTAILDPSTVPGGYSFEKMRDHLASRVPLVPKLTRRVEQVPFRLHHPIWVDDPDFRVEDHVHRACLDPPGDERALARFVAEMASQPLDRSRALWEFWIVEGLSEGRIALTGKVHHCAIDGVSAADLMPAFFGLSPEPDPVVPPDGRPATRPSDLELVGWSVADRAVHTGAGIAAIGRVGLAALGVRVRRRTTDNGSGGTPLATPRTPYNGAITAGRSVAFGRLPLKKVKRVREATGTKVNDVILATAAGALRAHLQGLDELPDQPLVAAVPMSVRPEEQRGKGETGNRLSMLFVPLHSEIADPLERLRVTAADSQSAKQENALFGSRTLADLAEVLDPLGATAALELYSRAGLADRHRPPVNAVVSNVPGPPMPIYLGGAKALRLFPMGPVVESVGINLTVLSYRNHLDVGLLAASALVPDASDVLCHLRPAFDELVDAAL